MVPRGLVAIESEHGVHLVVYEIRIVRVVIVCWIQVVFEIPCRQVATLWSELHRVAPIAQVLFRCQWQRIATLLLVKVG